MSAQRVVIIGAGIGGLATAALLAKAGYEVSVYEKNAEPGGRAGKLSIGGFQFDTGPSWYLMPDVFDHFYTLLDTSAAEQLDLVQLSPAYKVFFEHQPPITIATNAATDAATFEAIEPGAGKALERYVKRGHTIYQLALRHFLYTNFSSFLDIVRHDIVRHGVRMTLLALTPIDRYISRFFRDDRLKHILEYTMVFLGASPYRAPALYSLMGALDFKEGVYYPRGGMYTVIDSLLRLGTTHGVTYHFDSPVQRIISSGGRATSIELADGAVITADVIISNADLHFTETQLLAPTDRTYPARYWRAREAGPSALLLYLGIEGSLPELEHHSLFFVDKWKENFNAIYETKTIPDPASIYVAKASATDPHVAPAGNEAVVVLVPLPPGISLNDAEQTRLADTYIDQLARMSGIADFAERIISRTIVGPNDFARNFNAWQSTALGPSHTLRQSAFFRTGNRSKKLKNLYYVGGSTIPGVGLPMCLIGAELVYKHLAGDKRGGRVMQIQPIGKRD